MTPKEKAIERVNKYKNAPFNCKDCDMPYCDIPCTQLNISESKECALISIGREIESIMWLNALCPFHDYMKEHLKLKIKELKQIEKELKLL